MIEVRDGLNDRTLAVEIVGVAVAKAVPRRDLQLPGPTLRSSRRASSWDEVLEVGPDLLLAAGSGKAVRVTDLLTQQSEIFRSADDFGRFTPR